ncbi:hypothetical protein HDU91_000681, partial [Kappamyces sp. JEL0680]
MFFSATDGIFVNYTWTLEKIRESAANARERRCSVYTGIDVWGRNTFGGGQFNVHKALREIRRVGTSVAIFAPAWTFEHLGPEQFPTHEKKFWLDSSLPLGTEAECAMDKTDLGCVADYISPRAIEHHFHSVFGCGFGSRFFIDGACVSTQPWIQLSSQSISLSYPLAQPRYGVLHDGAIVAAKDSPGWLTWDIDEKSPFNGGSSLSFYPLGQHLRQTSLGLVYFYRADIPVRPDQSIQVVFKALGRGVKLGICVKSSPASENVFFGQETALDH